MRYLIILEPTSTGYSAYSPDLDGCAAAGADREETIALMGEAIAFHLEGLSASGKTAYVEVIAVHVAEGGQENEVSGPPS